MHLRLQRLQVRLPALGALAAASAHLQMQSAAALLHAAFGFDAGIGQPPLQHQPHIPQDDGRGIRRLPHRSRRHVHRCIDPHVPAVVLPTAAPAGLQPGRSFERTSTQELHAWPLPQPLTRLAQVA